MRLLHTMLRVGDLQRSIDFYTKVLGMRLLRTSENTEYKYSLAFVGYSDESVDDVAATCDNIRQAGGKVTREAGPVKGGTTVIAFVEDPDGYKIELIENKHAGHGLGN